MSTATVPRWDLRPMPGELSNPLREHAANRDRQASIGFPQTFAQTLDRPHSLNAIEVDGEIGMIDGAMLNAYPNIRSRWLIADHAPLRGLIVTGAGTAFSAGGDVTWFKEGVEDPDATCLRTSAAAPRSAPGDHRLRRIPYPVIARSTARRPAPGSPWRWPAISASPATRRSSPPPTGASARRPTAA